MKVKTYESSKVTIVMFTQPKSHDFGYEPRSSGIAHSHSHSVLRTAVPILTR